MQYMHNLASTLESCVTFFYEQQFFCICHVYGADHTAHDLPAKQEALLTEHLTILEPQNPWIDEFYNVRSSGMSCD